MLAKGKPMKHIVRLSTCLVFLFSFVFVAGVAEFVAPQPALATGCFGTDAGAGSMNWNVHYTWAQARSRVEMQNNLDWKVRSVFGCNALDSAELTNAFADLSTVIGRYVPDPACFHGDVGAASTSRSTHWRWAHERSRAEIRANFLMKVDDAMECLSRSRDLRMFADLSVILARYGG
jgi:hypothetical protein